MGGEDRVVGSLREEQHFSGTVVGHRSGEWVFGIEDRISMWRDRFDSDTLHASKLLWRVDTVQAEVVAIGNVRHDGRVTEIKAQAFAKNATASSLQYSSLHNRIGQHGASTLRSAAISRVDPSVVDVHAVGASHADPFAGASQQMSDQSSRRRLAVCSGDRNRRNTTIVALSEHRTDDRFAHRTAFAVGWFEVHS